MQRFAAISVVTGAALALAGCGVFRPLIRDWSNQDMTGRTAPPLEGGEWVIAPDGAAARTAPDSWQPPDARWRMLVFFLPH